MDESHEIDAHLLQGEQPEDLGNAIAAYKVDAFIQRFTELPLAVTQLERTISS